MCGTAVRNAKKFNLLDVVVHEGEGGKRGLDRVSEAE